MSKAVSNNISLNYDLHKDPFYKFVNSDENFDYTENAVIPDRIIDFDKFSKGDFNIKLWLKSKKNRENSIYIKHIREQVNELEIVKKQALNFYSKTEVAKNSKPIDVNKELLSWQVRIIRLREILLGRNSNVVISHSKKSQKYHVVKGYWCDDYANTSRNYIKSVLKVGAQFESKLIDVYEDMGYTIQTNYEHKTHRFKSDLVISKGKEFFIVELGDMKIEDLSKIVLNFSMWND
jgi:hypothetical protein